MRLPVGLVRTRAGAIAWDPDQDVPGAVRTVDAQFEALRSANAVRPFFRTHGLRIPRRSCPGADAGELHWVKPTDQAIHQFIVPPSTLAPTPTASVGQSRQCCRGWGGASHAIASPSTNWRS
jgi:hypothetical protein